MSIPTYTQGYPPDGFSLGATKAVIRDNLDGTFLTLGVDHINNNGDPGANPAGYHNVIHMVEQSAVPVADPGVTQVFSMIPTSAIPPGDVQLFSMSGGGGISQLTGNLNATNGYQWIGGVLLQWGFDGPALAATTTGIITFPVPFPSGDPTKVFSIQLTTLSPAGVITPSIIPRQVQSTGITSAGFTWRKQNAVGDQGMYWLAIGV